MYMTQQSHDDSSRSHIWWKALIACLLIIASTLFVYWKVGSYEFTNFDDHFYVTGNKHVQQGLTLDNLKWAFSVSKGTDKSYWHPLTWLSHMADCEMFGLNAGAHHLVSLFIHIANALLLFAVLGLMTGAPWKSAFVAALFALHPLNVDSVAWIAERKNVLSTFFCMFTILAYIYYAKRPSLSRYLLVTTAFIASLLSKPMLVTLPAALLLLDYWPLYRIQTNRLRIYGEKNSGYVPVRKLPLSRIILEKIPLVAISCIVTLLSVISMHNNELFVTKQIAPFGLRVENAIVSYVEYIGKIFWPHPLAVYYPFPESIPVWQVIGALFLLAVITIIAIAAARKLPYLIVGWLWFIGTLVPVIGIVQGGLWPAMADRWAYVPAIGIFIMVSWGMGSIIHRWLRLRIVIVVIALAALLACTFVAKKQTTYWKNSITLFSHALAVTRDNYLSEYNLGQALSEKGMDDAAMPHYYKSLQFNPNNLGTYIDLGIALAKKGRTDESIKYFRMALIIRSKDVVNKTKAHINLGIALQQKGRTDEAMSQYHKALTLEPDNFAAHFNLGNALMEKGLFKKAADQYRMAIKIKPEEEKAYKNLGQAFFKQGRLEEAAHQFNKALKINPKDPEVYNGLGATFIGRQNMGRAETCFKNALKINPGYADARNNLQRILTLKEKIQEALENIKEKLKSQPKSPEVYYKMGNAYLSSHFYQLAIENYQKALSMDPGYTDAMYNLAIAHAENGEYNDAVASFKKIIATHPENAAVYYNIACIYSRQNKKNKAVDWLKQSIAHGYNNWEQIKTDKDMENLRTTPFYRELMKNH